MTKVMIGVVHGQNLDATFAASKDALVAYDKAHEGYLTHDTALAFVRCGTDGLVQSRNTVAQTVVDSDVDYLLWIDSDMGFEPDSLSRLVAVADPVDRPVVGALCFSSKQVAHDGMNGFRSKPVPTVYRWLGPEDDPDGRLFTVDDVYPVNSIVQVAGTGSAFILIHRSVFEKIGRDWYTRVPDSGGQLLGEDISFCVRAGAAGLPIVVHTGVRTTHVKAQWLAEADYWRLLTVPPATEPVMVCAGLNSLDDAYADMSISLWASTGLADLESITDDEIGRSSAIHGEPPWTWLVFLGDGAYRFHPGWFDHACHVAERLDLDVVALNDLTPSAMTGFGSSVLMVRSSHYAVDPTTWLRRAVAEGRYGVSLGSVVELLA